MAGEEVDFVQAAVGFGVDATGAHEPQGAIDLGGEAFVLLALWASGDELLRPGMDPAQIGKTTFDEGAQQVERRCALVVGLDEALGIGVRDASVGPSPLTMWPRKLGSCTSPTISNGDERGLANCPAIRPTLTTGTPSRIGQHDGHLQDDAQLFTDVDRRELLEALGTVACLQQEGIASGHFGQRARAAFAPRQRRPVGDSEAICLRARSSAASSGHERLLSCGN